MPQADSLSPAERRLRGKIAADSRWGKIPEAERPHHTAKARRGLENKFLAEAEGDPVRAESLRKAFYARLALKSSRARARRRGGDAA